MWDKLKKGDSATVSVFILEGSQLKANVILEGPFANDNVENTHDLVIAEQKFTTEGIDQYRWTQHAGEIVDFEHIQIETDDDEDEDEEEHYADDDDDDAAHPEEDIEVSKKRIQERRNRRAAARRRAQAQRRKRVQIENERRKLLTDKIRKEGEPYQKTLKAEADGWYRACVAASFDKIMAEFQFRTSQELGGVDPETGHVFTWAMREDNQEEGLLDAATAEGEADIQPEDFLNTRNQLRELRQALNQISTLQQQSKNRMTGHAQIAEHSNSKMRQNSLLITMFFLAVTAFQVYTIHRWFCTGNESLLAR